MKAMKILNNLLSYIFKCGYLISGYLMILQATFLLDADKALD